MPLLFPIPLAHAGSRTIRDAGVEITLSATPVANLVYQLDCAAGVDRCIRPAFQRFWEETLITSDADRDAIERWRAVNTAYGGEVEVGRLPPSPLLLRPIVVRLREKLRRASLLAEDVDAYCEMLPLVVHPADAPAFCGVARHFAARFESWWEAEAESRLEEQLGRYAEVLAGPTATASLGRILRFYDRAGVTLHLDLVLQPFPTDPPLARAVVMGAAEVATASFGAHLRRGRRGRRSPRCSDHQVRSSGGCGPSADSSGRCRPYAAP